MNRLLIALVIVFIGFSCLASSIKPVMVLSTCLLQEGFDSGKIYPEIAVSPDGTWREATLEDLWDSQEFVTIGNYVPGIKLTLSSPISELPTLFKMSSKSKYSTLCFAVYSNKKPFTNKGIEKPITPRSVDSIAQKELEKQPQDVKKMLENVVKLDWKNIKKDFSQQKSSKVESYLVADINGDSLKDYILILGENFGTPEASSVAIVVYLRDSGSFKRIPVAFWKNATDDSGWPVLVLGKDFNGDKAEELMIGDAYTELTYPVIYSWSKEGLVKIYQGEIELWQ